MKDGRSGLELGGTHTHTDSSVIIILEPTPCVFYYFMLINILLFLLFSSIVVLMVPSFVPFFRLRVLCLNGNPWV